MITSKDIRFEFDKAKQTIKTDEGKALLKVIEVVCKVVLNVRVIVDKIREKSGIERIKSLPKKDINEQKEETE